MSGWKETKSGNVTIVNHSTSNTIEIKLVRENLKGDDHEDSYFFDIEELENIAKCIDNIRYLEPNCL